MEKTIDSFGVLKILGADFFRTKQIGLDLLKGDGSERKIYRVYPLSDSFQSVIGVWQENITENQTFHLLTREMKKVGIPVPEFYRESEGGQGYLQQDLGRWNLAETIDYWKAQNRSGKIIPAYKTVLDYLPPMQRKMVDPLKKYLPDRLMNFQFYQDDIQYFYDNFFQLHGFGKLLSTALKTEIEQQLIQFTAKIEGRSFVFRDFQSRNIMWKDNSPWFIDYQSALLGTLYYDLASLLYASHSGLDENMRLELMSYYYEVMEFRFSPEEFRENFYKVLLLRRLRSLGSYCYLSAVKGKEYFLKGIQPTLEELDYLLGKITPLSNLKELSRFIKEAKVLWQGENG